MERTPTIDLTLDNLRAAWEHVQFNDGCAGVDGVSVELFEQQAEAGLPELLKQCESGAYLALPLRMLVASKDPQAGKKRTLLVPTLRDRIVQTAVASRLSRSFEEEFFDASFGYRPDRGVDRAIARIIQLRDRGFLWILDADISAFFDSVSHNLLRRQLEQDSSTHSFLPLLKQWIEATYWDGHELHRLKRGVPQGAPISPLLANLFLTPVDQSLEKSQNHLIRYADDFLLLCQTEESAQQARLDVAQILHQRGLELNEEKTRITNFEQGFSFLGVSFRGREVFVPWKFRHNHGRVIFIARPMPPRLLREYRKETKPPAPSRNAAEISAATPTPQPFLGAEEVPFLYIAEQGAILRKSGDRFLVEADQTIRLDIPYHRLQNILIFGNVQVTTQALSEALDKGIAFSFFTRHGRLRGSLIPAAGRNVTLRVNQYGVYLDEQRSLAIARSLIRAKILNGEAVLKRYQDRGKGDAQTERAIMANAVSCLTAATSRAEVDGLEGAAARAYFTALMRFNVSPFLWPGRVKHPATDPLNALLSLSYTLLMNELASLLEASGLDPALGMLHELDPNRPSLALDLMEPFRAPLADRFVLTSVNRAVFQPTDFIERDDHGSTVLKPPAMRRFFESYEHWMHEPAGAPTDRPSTFRLLLRREVENLCHALQGHVDFAPYLFDAPEAPQGVQA